MSTGEVASFLLEVNMTIIPTKIIVKIIVENIYQSRPNDVSYVFFSLLIPF